jgi:signal recognition particle subunit SRP72
LTQYIALNNVLAVIPHKNPFVAQRVYQSVVEPVGGDSPFTHQAVTLTQNSYTINLLAHKYPGVQAATEAAVRSAPEASTQPKFATLSVLNAAAIVKNTAGKDAINTLLSLLEKRPFDVGLLLTIIQLYVLTNNLYSATALLEKFLKKLDAAEDEQNAAIKFTPGLVGVAVELYNAQGRRNMAKKLLVNAANYWKSHPSSTSGAASKLLLRAAGAGMILDPAVTEEEAKIAIPIFEDLHNASSNDGVATAGLVAARCIANDSTSTGEIESIAKHLTPVTKLIAGIDVSKLESGGIFSPPITLVSTTKKRSAEEGGKKEDTKKPDESQPVKKRKLSKKRMPEDYEEGKKMDPERWLPLKERSSWRPKGKKGKARAAGLTQGGVVEDRGDKGGSAGVVTGGGGMKPKKAKKKVKK